MGGNINGSCDQLTTQYVVLLNTHIAEYTYGPFEAGILGYYSSTYPNHCNFISY